MKPLVCLSYPLSLFLPVHTRERRKAKRAKGPWGVRECVFPSLSTRRCNPEIRLNVGYPAQGTSPFLSQFVNGRKLQSLPRSADPSRASSATHSDTHTQRPRHAAPVCIDVRPLNSRIQLKAWTANNRAQRRIFRRTDRVLGP